MKFQLTKRALLACCLASGFVIPDAHAQVVDSAATVTSDSSTWIQPATGNAVTLSSGTNGVTILNEEGGVIESVDATGVENAGNNTIDNAGRITGAVNGVDFVNGSGSGTLINRLTGLINSASRALNIGGTVDVTNEGDILGTGDQRNGTVYSNISANNFSIDNSGTIDAGTGNLGAGFSAELSSTGTDFTLDNSGTIAGRGNAGAGLATAGDGIRLERTRIGGVLDATTTGLFTGTINNSGSITSEGANGTVGGFRAVNGVSFQGELNNSGTISGTQNGVYFGNPTPAGGGDHTGGVVNNSGTISSDSRAFNIDGIGLEVNNSGQIVGTGNQRNGTVYADETAQDFTLNNQVGGVIDAGQGFDGAAFSVELAESGNNFDINNAGTIAGRGNAAFGAAAAGDGIRLERTRNAGILDATSTGLYTGTITNSGEITSEGANGAVSAFRAVNGVSFQGTLNNEAGGVIAGVQNGVYFGNPTGAGGGDHTGGVVNNAGVISSDSRAFNIDGIGLEVNNSGQILGTGNQRNGTVYADSSAQGFVLNNLSGGVIDAGAGNNGAGFSVELSAAGNDFDINNAGTIAGRGNASAGAPAAGDGIRLERTRNAGLLDATSTGLFTGTITNSGSITSEGANGTVSGFRAVNGVSFQGELNNSGTISGTQNGVYFGNPVPVLGGADHTGGVVNNTGVISSDSRALNIDGIGLTVNNDGLILATGTQRNGTIYADEPAQDFVLNNSGVVDAGAGLEGAAFSVELSETGNNFTINNSGQLLGRGAASAGAPQAGDGIRLERTRNAGVLDATSTGLFTGVINNTGTISSESNQGTTGGFRAVNGVSFQGTLNNSGTISGVQNGVYFGNPVPVLGGADHTGGVVNNFGVISSDSRAFNLDGIGLTVNNAGDILATGTQRNGTFYLDGAATGFTVNNQAGGTIDARGGSGSGISFQVGGPLELQTGSFTNAGSIFGAGGGPVDAGIRLFDGNGTLPSTFQGNIVNEATGLITADSGSDAILVQEGVDFDGAVINRGTIDGSVSLATGDLFYEDSSVQSLLISSATENELVDVTTGELVFDGTLDLGFLFGFTPEVGQEFDLFDFGPGQASGGFDQILAQGVIFDTARLLTEGVLQIANVDGFVATVPEPSSLVLFALGGTACLGRRRRRS